MNPEKNTLINKTVALTGSTGGLGKEICDHLASCECRLILLDRNTEKSEAHRQTLIEKYPNADIVCVNCNLEDIDSVDKAVKSLIEYGVDIFIHNAGAYSIPRHRCSTGYDNVYQINFVSPYYMIRRLLPTLRQNRGRAVAVGSIAHNYSKIDENDIDFSKVKPSSRVYGNAKRYLMFSLFELFKNEDEASLSIAHPGITFTNITAHYPPLIFALIKHPMKVIFMKPKKAVLSVIKAIYEECSYLEWWGPRFFDIWGMPRKRKLSTCTEKERRTISEISERVYKNITEQMEEKI